jgi:hypothetical protein
MKDIITAEGRALALLIEDILLEKIERDMQLTLEELHAEREAQFVEWFDNYTGEGDDLEDEGDTEYFVEPEVEIATPDHPALIRAIQEIEDLPF